MASEHSGLAVEQSVDRSRRATMARAALVAGGIGAAALARAPRGALANHDTSRDHLKFEGFNNVKDFDPANNHSQVGTPGYDSRPAIQACINASKDGAATVYFPPGTYRCDTALFLPSGTRLVGHGSASVIRANFTQERDGNGDCLPRVGIDPSQFDPTDILQCKATPALLKSDFAGGDTITDIHISHLKVDGGTNKPDILDRAFHLIQFGSTTATDKIQNLVVESVEFVGARSWSVVIATGPTGGGPCRIEDSIVHGGGRDGINIASNDLVIRGNLVYEVEDDHIIFGGKRNTVVNNVVVATRTKKGGAIVNRGGIEGGIIAGNVCVGGVNAGILVTGQFQPIRDLVVADNVVVNSGRAEPPPGPDPELQFGPAGGSGIAVMTAQGSSADVERVTIAGNLIVNPRLHGIHINPVHSELNERQLISFTGQPTGGTFKLELTNPATSVTATSGAITYSTGLTAATVDSALEAMPNVGAGQVSVTGPNGGPFTVTFTGSLAAADVQPMTPKDVALTGGTSPGVTVTTLAEGGVPPTELRDIDVVDNVIAMGPKTGAGSPAESAPTRSGISTVWWFKDGGGNWQRVLPSRPVIDVRLENNEIWDATGPGIHVERSSEPLTGELISWVISDNRVFNSGLTTTPMGGQVAELGLSGEELAGPQPGILVDRVVGVTISGNRLRDGQSQKTQKHGISLLGPSGRVSVMRNHVDGLAGSDPPFKYAYTSPGPAMFRIRDNSFQPWVGEKTLGGWSGSGPYVAEVTVTFGARFVDLPRVMATVKPAVDTDLDAYVTVKFLTSQTCTLRVVSSTNPGASDHRVSWRAEAPA